MSKVSKDTSEPDKKKPKIGICPGLTELVSQIHQNLAKKNDIASNHLFTFPTGLGFSKVLIYPAKPIDLTLF